MFTNQRLTWFNLPELLDNAFLEVDKKIQEGGGTSLPVSATQSGIVNNIPLQELGGVDKLINGVRIGKGNSTGSGNTVIGINSQTGATTANENSSFGFGSLQNVTSGGFNSAFGWGSLSANTIGSSNDAFGDEALKSNVSGTFNTALGSGSISNNILGHRNVAIGSYALSRITGDSNENVYLGNRNVAVGVNALKYATIGCSVAIGDAALGSATTGSNIGIGSGAGNGITTGTGNIVIGSDYTNINNGITTGNNNLLITQNNGGITGLTTGSGNTIIGKVTGLATTLTNTIIISDGVGTQRFISDSTNLSRLPAQTLVLIDADATKKAIITKEYTDRGITINGTTIPIGGSTTFTTPAQTTITAALGTPYINTTITRTTVSGWTFAVTAGKNYRVEIIASYQTAVVTTGGSIGFILSSGTGTIRGIMNGEIAQTTVATGVRTTIRAIDATNTTAGSFMTTTGVGVINSPHYIGGILAFTCTTSGVFEVQFASEVAASSAQLNTGSLLLVTEY